MIVRGYALKAAGVAAIFGVSCWNNNRLYKTKTWGWKTSKALIETIVLSAVIACGVQGYQVLIAWSTYLLVRPTRTPGIRVVLSILCGAMFELLLLAKLAEVLVLVSVFAIDLVTGTNGFLKRKKEVEDSYGGHGSRTSSHLSQVA